MIEVAFEGRVQSAKSFSWGNVLKVSHAQRRKNDATGEWETVGYDNFDVVLPQGANPAAFPEKSFVTISGSLTKTDTYAKNDGTTGISHRVRAQIITASEPKRAGNYDAAANLSSIGATPIADEDMPF